MKPRRPFQFSIAMLLALTGLVAVITWALVSEPTKVTGAMAALLVPAFPALSITGCMSTKGYGRVFWVGAASCSVLAVMGMGPLVMAVMAEDDVVASLDGANMIRPVLALWWGTLIPVGLLCVAFRWLLLRGAETVPE